MTLTLNNILIVDDQPAILEQWHTELQPHFKSVIQASSGDRALEICDMITPDLILSDLDMPDIDGFDLIRRLKANPQTSQIPLIICSSTQDATTQYLCLTLGAIAYLKKPLNLTELFEALEKSSHQLAIVA